MQASLFDVPADPTFRKSDPATSKAASRTIATNAREAEVLEAMRGLTVASTAADISAYLKSYGLPRDQNCVSRRLTSLERAGVVRRCGVKAGASGRACSLWRLA